MAMTAVEKAARVVQMFIALGQHHALAPAGQADVAAPAGVQQTALPHASHAQDHQLDHANALAAKYDDAAQARRTARAQFAASHGEASADYRTWSPQDVALAKSRHLFTRGYRPRPKDSLGRLAGGGGMAGRSTVPQGTPPRPEVPAGQLPPAQPELQQFGQPDHPASGPAGGRPMAGQAPVSMMMDLIRRRPARATGSGTF